MSWVARVVCCVGLLAFADACKPVPVDKEPETAPSLVISDVDPVVRYSKAVQSAAPTELSFRAAEAISKKSTYKGGAGKLYTDRLEQVTNIPPSVAKEDITKDAEIMALMWDKDEEAVARALYNKGARVLLLHSDVSFSMDRGAVVLSRLYHHDYLEWFSLMWVGDGLMLYEIREKPLEFSPELATQCIQYLRSRLATQAPTELPPVQSETGNWTLSVILRGSAKEHVIAFAQDESLQGTLEELIVDIERDHRRKVELLGFPPLYKHIEDLSIEIERVVERSYIEPRSDSFLEDYWEPGIDGAYMMTKDKRERSMLPASVSYTRTLWQVDKFLKKTASLGNMSERRPWRGDGSWLESLRAIQYRENETGGVTRLFRGVPEIQLEDVTLESIRLAIISAGNWYLRNLGPNGQIVYKFWPAENRYSSEYNLVRHTLATWNLAQAYQVDTSREDFLKGAELAWDFTEQFLTHQEGPPGNMAFYKFKNNQKLGTVVINLLGMIELARVTGTHRFDDQMVEMGNFILFLLNPDGTFNGYHVPEGHDYFGVTNDIVPGEAALALVWMAEYFDDDKWIEGLKAYWEYYDVWFAERSGKLQVGSPKPVHAYDPAVRLELVQMGPWTVMAAEAYFRRTGNKEVADFGLKVGRWMIDTYLWPSDDSPYPDFVGGYYKVPVELPAMQAFCYGEGTAAAYALALAARPEQAPFFEQATRDTMRFGLMMQFDEGNTYSFSRPEQVMGGIRYSMNQTKVRVDYVYHAQSSMVNYYNAAKGDPNLPESVRNGPAMPSQLSLLMESNEMDAEGVTQSIPAKSVPYPIPVKLIRPSEDEVTPLPVGTANRKKATKTLGQ